AAAGPVRHRRYAPQRGRRGEARGERRAGGGVRHHRPHRALLLRGAHGPADRTRAADRRRPGRRRDRPAPPRAVGQLHRQPALGDGAHRGHAAPRHPRAAAAGGGGGGRDGAGAADGEHRGGRAHQGGRGGAGMGALPRRGLRLRPRRPARATRRRPAPRPRPHGDGLRGQGGRDPGRHPLRHPVRRAPGRAHHRRRHRTPPGGGAGRPRPRPPLLRLQRRGSGVGGDREL
ncbi:MAG: hypothetical protein AVDCRST_MAG68-4094, partial [uncultured Gemmatimonadetes bacterium]